MASPVDQRPSRVQLSPGIISQDGAFFRLHVPPGYGMNVDRPGNRLRHADGLAVYCSTIEELDK